MANNIYLNGMAAKNAHVLVSPLNWGLGHAARCIPVVKALLDKGAGVSLAGNGSSLQLLKDEFPQLNVITLPGISVSYSKSGMNAYAMLMKLPGYIYSAFREQRALKQILRELKVDVVISDNRYGLYPEECYSVFIGHQHALKIPSPFASAGKPASALSEKFVRKFDECWIPDDSSHSLSGELSMNHLSHARYTGPLSRFYHSQPVADGKRYDVLLVLSGPEPQRSLLEQKIISHHLMLDKTVLVVRGKAGSSVTEVKGKVTYADTLPTSVLHHHLISSTYVICRAGYSSIMDLAAIGRSAIIIPTPGQTEQEYLGKLHHNKSHYCLEQQNPDLERAFNQVNRLNPVKPATLLSETINRLLSRIG